MFDVVLGSYDFRKLQRRVREQAEVTCFVAKIGEECVAFKIGYALSTEAYYSWLGGVMPNHRGRGLARMLMEHQHNWARQLSFTEIETKVRLGNTSMELVNLRFGFKAVGGGESGGIPHTLFRKIVKGPTDE